MDTSQIATYARVLIEAHGPEAEVVAARRQAAAHKAGNGGSVELWRRVRAALSELKGPHHS